MKKGKLAVEILLLLILVVVISAVVLSLVNTGLITVKAENEVSLVNTEFIGMGRGGHLAIKDFQFCAVVTDDYECVEPLEAFSSGEEVHFRLVVETSTHNGDVMIKENYKLLDPNGNVLLDVDEKNNFHFDVKSKDKAERITLKDFFVSGDSSPEGTYTLEMHLENPLLNKNVKQVYYFDIYQ